MNEVSHYIKTLRTRDLGTVYRELRSRFTRESPKVCVERLLDLLSEFSAVFTFFITGQAAKRNKAAIKRIIDAGHEIACHGYYHKRFDLMGYNEISKDIKQSMDLFKDYFGYSLKGFRAPYLCNSEGLIKVLRDLGFSWSSSIRSESGMFVYPQGLWELPIKIDDWEILIKNNKNGAKSLFHEMTRKARGGSVFLLHPWRVGQRRYIDQLEEFLEKCEIGFCSMSDLAKEGKGIALTGDIGELSLSEIMQRALGL